METFRSAPDPCVDFEEETDKLLDYLKDLKNKKKSSDEKKEDYEIEECSSEHEIKEDLPVVTLENNHVLSERGNQELLEMDSILHNEATRSDQRPIIMYKPNIMSHLPPENANSEMSIIEYRTNRIRKQKSPKKYCEILERRFSNQKRKKKRIWTDSDKRAVAFRQNYICFFCEQRLPENYEIDHVQELAISGNNHMSNAKALCPNCHAQKTSYDRKCKIERWIGEKMMIGKYEYIIK